MSKKIILKNGQFSSFGASNVVSKPEILGLHRFERSTNCQTKYSQPPHLIVRDVPDFDANTQTHTHTIVGDGRSMQKSFFCQISMAQKRVVNSATTLVACGTYIYILYYIILYYIILLYYYIIVLYYIMLYYIILYHIILYYVILYYILYYIIL